MKNVQQIYTQDEHNERNDASQHNIGRKAKLQRVSQQTYETAENEEPSEPADMEECLCSPRTALLRRAGREREDKPADNG